MDSLLARFRTPQYNCQEFARDVWMYITGRDISTAIPSILGQLDQRKIVKSEIQKFCKLKTPINPCFVVCTQHGLDPHIGVYIGSGVLHLGRHIPALVSMQYFTVGYTDTRYYTW